MAMLTAAHEFPQFGKSIWNLLRTREEVFGGDGYGGKRRGCRGGTGVPRRFEQKARRGGCGCGQERGGSSCGGGCAGDDPFGSCYRRGVLPSENANPGGSWDVAGAREGETNDGGRLLLQSFEVGLSASGLGGGGAGSSLSMWPGDKCHEASRKAKSRNSHRECDDAVCVKSVQGEPLGGGLEWVCAAKWKACPPGQSGTYKDPSTCTEMSEAEKKNDTCMKDVYGRNCHYVVDNSAGCACIGWNPRAKKVDHPALPPTWDPSHGRCVLCGAHGGGWNWDNPDLPIVQKW